MDDWNLLDAYARNGSEPAFRQLVERHLGLVHTAALRQVHDPGLAEDIAQAVFVLLARKAPSFNRKVILAGWLFRTTRFLAGQARRTEERRRRREQEAHAMHPAESNDPSWSQIAPELDTALDSLRPDDREAVLLRFAEDRSHREIGERLGLNEASARKRVTRAVHRLRQILLARGLAPTLSLTALSALLAERLVAAPPPDLAHRISTTASAIATPLTNTAPAVSPTTQLLVQQTLDAWRRAWTTKAFAVAGAIGIVALAILTFRLLTPAGLPGPTPSPPATTTVASASGSTAPTPPNPRDLVRARHAADTFELRVVDADTDTPIPAAQVPVRYVVGGEWISRTDLVTDAHGLCRVPIPQGDLQRFDAGAHAPGWENRFTTWRNDWPFPRPARHTLRLRRADILGGRVTHAATGQPVPGATVWIDYKISDTNWREPAEDVEREGSFQRLPLGLTDADGRWTCSVLPPSRAHAWITVEHPDCVPTSIAIARPSADLPPSESWTQLVTETHVAPLQPGFRVEGQAVDPENSPLEGIRIATTWHEKGVQTDREGRFTLASQPRGEILLIAQSETFAPLQFRAQAGGPAVRITLAPGGELRVRLTRPDGTPIEGGTLSLDDGFGDGAMGWTGTSDTDGRIVWRGAPRDRSLAFNASAPGFLLGRGFRLRTGAPEHTLVLTPAIRVTGLVVDDRTGQPIPWFKAIPGHGREPSSFSPSDLTYGTNGTYAITFTEAGFPALRIEAPGYLPTVGFPSPDPGAERDPNLRCDLRLQSADPSLAIRGTLRNPDGSIADTAEVALLSLERSAVLERHAFAKSEADFQTVVRTDAAGAFAFAPTRNPHTVVAISRAGFARQRVRPGETLELQLQPFGRIEGTAFLDGQPAANHGVHLNDTASQLLLGHLSLGSSAYAKADAEGRFQIEDVPPGDYELLIATSGSRLIHPTHVEVRSGQTTRVHPGQPDPQGRTVHGRIRCTDPALASVWTGHILGASLQAVVPRIPVPPALTGDELALWHHDWHATDEALAFRRSQRRVEVQIRGDGSFTALGVVPGAQRLVVSAVSGSIAQRGLQALHSPEWEARLRQEITVPAADPGTEPAPVDLGTFDLVIRRR